MPPRRSARLVELANPHFQLPFPPNIVALLFSLLPLDARLRSLEVCRGWRFFLEDASFWTHVDLSVGCGVHPRFLLDSRLALALLRAACLRAMGDLQSVDISGVHEGDDGDDNPFVMLWLDSASVADKASLRDLVAPTSCRLDHEQVAALCRTVPLCRVRCNVRCSPVEALPLLRREPPFALLTMGNLCVFRMEDGELLDLASALSVYKGMRELTIYAEDAPLTTRAAVDALVNAAISAGIKDMSFCGLTQTALPALGRLLQSPGFERLYVYNHRFALFEGPALPAFCDALRNGASLKALELHGVNFWEDLAAALQLIAALEVHPSLQRLELHGNPTDGTPVTQRAVGECLARLIARSSSLSILGMHVELGEAGMTPIFEALTGDSGLKKLALIGEHISADFARDVVLPAVRASTSLRKLEGLRSVAGEPLPAMEEVKDILEARVLADKEAD